jgi:hypothetical protein
MVENRSKGYLMKTKHSPIKDVFKSMNINQPYKLSKTAPVFTPPKEVAHFELPLKEEPQAKVPQSLRPSIEVTQKKESQFEVPKNEEAASEAPQKKPAHSKSSQSEAAKIGAPQSEIPKKEVPHNYGFFKFAHSVFTDKKLQGVSGDCFRLFLWLSTRAWRFSSSEGTIRASVSYIESETGMSHASISRGLKTLKELHLISLVKLDYKLGNTWEVASVALGTSPTDPDKKLPHFEPEATSKVESHTLKLSEGPPQNEAQNKNIKNYKDLSQEEHELFEKIDLIDSPAKRKKERDALVGLLEQKPADLILRAYRFVIANGTLGRQDTCHHPFCYLLSTIDDILQKIKVPVKTEIALSIADFDEEKNFENALSLLKVFQTSVDLDTREKMIV